MKIMLMISCYFAVLPTLLLLCICGSSVFFYWSSLYSAAETSSTTSLIHRAELLDSWWIYCNTITGILFAEAIIALQA